MPIDEIFKAFGDMLGFGSKPKQLRKIVNGKTYIAIIIHDKRLGYDHCSWSTMTTNEQQQRDMIFHHDLALSIINMEYYNIRKYMTEFVSDQLIDILVHGMRVAWVEDGLPISIRNDFGKEIVISPAVLNEAPSYQHPADDEEDDDCDEKHQNERMEAHINREVTFEYTNSKGNSTYHTIIAKFVYEDENGNYIVNGLCQSRNINLTFRADRMFRLTDHYAEDTWAYGDEWARSICE